MSQDANTGEPSGSPLGIFTPLLGDDAELAAKHPKKLHEFFEWSTPWKHNLEPISNDSVYEVEHEKEPDTVENP